VLIAVMATGMFGFFHVRLPNFIYMLNPDQESVPGSFGLGILTAVLSTPCTAPFMGAAAAWAATQPPAVTLAAFAAIGTGMALPYGILTLWPALVSRLPRSGPGSVLMKEVLGWLMLAAAAYFIGSGISALLAQAPDPPGRMYWWAVAACTAAAGLWLTVGVVRMQMDRHRQAMWGSLGVLMVLLAVGLGLRLTDRGPIDWVYFTPERLAAARQRQQPVMLVFTAEWCLNCKALEQGVLRQPRLVEALETAGAVAMKADITGRNPAARAKLEEVGRLTIPLLVVFGSGGEIVMRSDFYTVEQVVAALREAG
jgi:thiol:disulfide interchange protein DsbD